ncbi:hypothetical protein [Brevibacterium sandarakinum]|nr:hypothetical protein [Brevibacterium sandarakinum]
MNSVRELNWPLLGGIVAGLVYALAGVLGHIVRRIRWGTWTMGRVWP